MIEQIRRGVHHGANQLFLIDRLDPSF